MSIHRSTDLRFSFRRADDTCLRKSGSLFLAVFCIPFTVLTIATHANAQAIVLPSTVEPSKAQERLIIPPEKFREQPSLLPQQKTDTLSAPPLASGGFVLQGIDVKGATVFTDKELSETYEDYIGLKADLNTIQFIAGRITQMYRDGGYLLSRAVVPEQNIVGGRASIVVVEGYVSQVQLNGDDVEKLQRKDAFKILNKISDKITAMRPLHGPTLESLLLGLDALPGIESAAILEPLPQASAAPGAVGLTIKLSTLPRAIGVSLDNFGSRYAGPFELSGNVTFTNNLLAFDRLSVAVLTTHPVKEAKVISGEYSLPVSDFGTSLDLRMGYSTLVPGYTLKVSDVRSKSYNAGIKITQNLFHTRKDKAVISAGVDLANIVTTTAGSELYKDRIRALRLSAQYDKIDGFGGTNSGNVIFSQGLDFLGAKETGSTNLSRATGHSDFTKIAASLSRLQRMGSSLQLYGAATGQYAFDPLLSSEEFGYGGQAFGRAYDSSEITGDSGVAASLELRYTGLPEWSDTIFQPFAFYDIGKVWKPDAAVNDRILSGSSSGVGLKFLYNQQINGYFAAAVPLTRPAAAPPGYANPTSPRFLFQLSAQF